ncbi:hypothetical protein MJC1_02293 [Methylocystis sp. MJC1]|nr:hypothetical protein MJC1_02293 [Methylocystis sp. MJC1]
MLKAYFAKGALHPFGGIFGKLGRVPKDSIRDGLDENKTHLEPKACNCGISLPGPTTLYAAYGGAQLGEIPRAAAARDNAPPADAVIPGSLANIRSGSILALISELAPPYLAKNLNASASTNFPETSPDKIGLPLKSSFMGFAPGSSFSRSRSTQKIDGL